MNWLTSPLAATVVVCAILAGLAIPLRKLTTGRALVPPPVVAAVSKHHHHHHGPGHVHEFAGVLRLRLLAPVESLSVKTSEGQVLWEAGALGAGEHEVDAELLLIDDAMEIHVEADFGGGVDDTALFLTILPDGVEEKTQYAIGAGKIDEVLFYEWDLH